MAGHCYPNYEFPVDNCSYRSTSCCPPLIAGVSPAVVTCPPLDSTFSDLQSFCNTARSSIAPNINQNYHQDYNDYPGYPHNLPSNFGCSQEIPPSDYYSHQADVYDDEEGWEDDDGADWFDLEALGLEPNGGKFDFPVPMEPVQPMNQLFTAKYDQHDFYVEQDGYVQVYTQGECYDPFRNAALGVWFGPNHPLNVSEKLYRGRRTQEAARFAAVIEAIRVAGSCGVKHLQINTNYINIVRFMIYFIYKWENNGWMTIRGTPVKNQVLVRELDFFSRLLEVKWNYVPTEDEAEGVLEATLLCEEALNLSYPEKRAENPSAFADISDRPLISEEPSSAQQMDDEDAESSIMKKRYDRFASN